MHLTMESTSEIADINGMKCRVWKGLTGKGVKCLVYVPVIAALQGEDQKEFMAELNEVSPAVSPEYWPIPLRMIL